DAFIPFSAGPANCVGRPFALLTLRMVVAHLMQSFDMKLEPSHSLEQYEHNLCDFFILQHGPL
ncbi:hypothetical protein GLOTRDRAFT_14073, partial [Gloeophyllum trabeum ATCC 11539]